MDNRPAMIALADQYLQTHKVTETWRIINMLRDELVRDGVAVPEGARWNVYDLVQGGRAVQVQWEEYDE